MRYWRWSILVGIAWYVLLATAHYLNQRPLWNDEQCVFNSIEGFKPLDLFTRGLSNGQIFPRVYLFLIQQISHLFNLHLLALRFLPFMSMLGAFCIWIYIAQREFKKDRDLFTFIACWAASIPLIYYAAELKQYSMDVLAASVFILFLYNQQQLEQRRNSIIYWLSLFLLPALILFSYTSILFWVFPLYNLIYAARKDKAILPLLFVFMGSCLMFFSLSYYFDVRISAVGSLRNYWQDYFISFDSWGEFFKTFGEGVNNLISRWFAEKPKWIRMVARFFVGMGFIQMFISFVKSVKKEGLVFYSINSVALVVFAQLVLLGALHRYPFSVPRMELFFAPALLLMTVKCIGNLAGKQKYLYWIVQGSFWVYLFIVSMGISLAIFGGDLGAQTVLFLPSGGYNH